jgi:hypothetical protein
MTGHHIPAPARRRFDSNSVTSVAETSDGLPFSIRTTAVIRPSGLQCGDAAERPGPFSNHGPGLLYAGHGSNPLVLRNLQLPKSTLTFGTYRAVARAGLRMRAPLMQGHPQELF